MTVQGDGAGGVRNCPASPFRRCVRRLQNAFRLMLLIKLLDGQLDKLRIIEAKARAKNREFLTSAW